MADAIATPQGAVVRPGLEMGGRLASAGAGAGIGILIALLKLALH